MNDSLAARRRDPAADDPAIAHTPVPDAPASAGQRESRHPDDQKLASEATVLELLEESTAARGTGSDAAPVPSDARLFGEVLIDTADDLLDTLQRERAENWAFRFDDPARASAADILEQLRSRTESLERISAACHGLLWHIRRAQEMGVLRTGPAGALIPAGWFDDLVLALAGTARRSAAGTVVRHPAWALTAVMERFRGADEVRQFLDRICAQSYGAVDGLLTGQVLPLVQSLRSALARFSLHRAP